MRKKQFCLFHDNEQTIEGSKPSKTTVQVKSLVPYNYTRQQAVAKVAEAFFPVSQRTGNFGRDESGVIYSLITTGLVTYIPRRKDDYHKYDLNNLRTWNTTRLLTFLMEYFPEMSKAIDTYIKVADTEFIFNVYEPDHGNKKYPIFVPSQAGQAAIKDNIQRINNYGIDSEGYNKHKGFRAFLREQYFNVLLGAASCESVYEEETVPRGTLKPYIVKKLRHQHFESVNPFTIKFSYDNIPYQTTATYGLDQPLDIPNFFYEANTFFTGYPYGRNQIVSIIRPALFKLELMDDIKLAVHKQGHPRIKVEVDDKIILAAAQKISPEDVRTPEQKVKFIQDVLDNIATNASNLKPDSCLAHLASQKWAYLEMQHTGQGMFNPDKLVEAIDTQVTSSLQTFPTLLGKSFAGNTQGYSSIESILYLIWVNGNQRIVCDMMAPALTQILHKEHNLIGFVTCRNKEPRLRATEEMAGFKANEIANELKSYFAGAIDKDELVRKLREITDHYGDPPEDAEMMIEYLVNVKQPVQPQVDPSQQPQKVQKKQQTDATQNQTGQ